MIEFELIFYWIEPGVATMTDNSGDELESTLLLWENSNIGGTSSLGLNWGTNRPAVAGVNEA